MPSDLVIAASAGAADTAFRLGVLGGMGPLALAHGRSALLARSVDPNQALAEAVVSRWLAVRDA